MRQLHLYAQSGCKFRWAGYNLNKKIKKLIYCILDMLFWLVWTVSQHIYKIKNSSLTYMNCCPCSSQHSLGAVCLGAVWTHWLKICCASFCVGMMSSATADHKWSEANFGLHATHTHSPNQDFNQWQLTTDDALLCMQSRDGHEVKNEPPFRHFVS